MIENIAQKRKHQTLKTQISINSKATEIQFGKLIKLPYIRKISTNNNTHQTNISRKSLQNKESKKHKHQSRQSELLGQTELNLLTLQEIQLCNQRTKYTEGFPKISGSNLAIFQRQKSFQSLEHHHKIRTDKSSTKFHFCQTLKDYKLGSVIGCGTYSVVRIGLNRQGKKFAIKTYLKSALFNQDRYLNLQSQITILKFIKNQFLLQFIQLIQTEDSINIVTNIFDNKSLSDCLKIQNSNSLNDQTTRLLLKQIIKGLSYLHSLDIVHRDLKIDNILVNKNFKIKLIDYGFSKQLPRQNYILHDFCGTPHYIAPEVIQRQGYLGKPADIWSLGIVLYRMVVGSFPFKGHNQKVLFSKVMKGQIKYPNDLSPDLKTLLQKMLTFDYRKRPTAQQLLKNHWLNT